MVHIRISIIITLIILFLTGSLPLLAAPELTIYTWEDYFASQVLENFTNKTGIQIKQEYFDSDQVRDETIATMNNDRFDLVIFDNVAAQIFGKNNRLSSISKSDVPNLKYLDLKWQESCGNFGMPYFYGTIGIVYDKTKYAKTPDSWKHLLQPAKNHSGHVVMVEDMNDTLAPALLYLGYNINTEKKSELKEAYTLLQNQVPHVLNYKFVLTNMKVVDQDKAMHIAFAYSGDQYTLNDTSGTENWQYIIPREGTAVWIDCLTIPTNSQNKKEALQLLNYLADPKVNALNTEEIYSMTPFSEARQYMSEEAASDPELFPEEGALKNLQRYRILSDENIRLRRRIFDSLLKQHETQ
ncbi:spermidine/putrescine ABC transporter substrate-binding protein [Desulfopila sp. IMCC35008]|uniref:polyamine ABC transporter substrate-binding protein n=1 Tax=Desulfopila sp. IMCC35008 TaxID=2653858 RepID=UPI0013D47917|nr:spermidine/putrescine ABC transporter substrate-binding protein [Desulfopila sp. IMCC35008]